MDYERKAEQVYDRLGRGSTADVDAIKADLRDAANEALERAAGVADERHRMSYAAMGWEPTRPEAEALERSCQTEAALIAGRIRALKQ